MDRIKIEFDAVSENEGFARVCVAAFATRLDPTLEEINDIKTAVSEAVTNSVIHGYNKKGGLITLTAEIEEKTLKVIIEDNGRGIDNVEKAMEPMFTTGADDERSGMGFTFMEVFMDGLDVWSEPGRGTRVTMFKRIGQETE
ncbi:MAG: anti-sigma F factor [Lachnospiraceae bacterium]|nr:anti-sigma F factor [Lachnospiraceae bacterium]